MKDKLLTRILKILEEFVDRRKSGRYFEKEYIKLWNQIRINKERYKPKIHAILNTLFLDVDEFVDPKLIKKFKKENKNYPKTELEKLDIDEEELIKRAKIALKELKIL